MTTKKQSIIQQITTPELYSFLKHFKLIKRVLRNITLERAKSCISIGYRFSFIAACFCFSESPEGWDFWSKYCDKESLFISKLKKDENSTN